jgi:pantoate--beta-alanine ligase
MSSRNRYLTPDQRTAAAALPRAMQSASAAMAGGTGVAAALGALEAELLAAGFASIDYATLADAASLAPLEALGPEPARLLVAARIGGTRLIDNLAVTR